MLTNRQQQQQKPQQILTQHSALPMHFIAILADSYSFVCCFALSK